MPLGLQYFMPIFLLCMFVLFGLPFSSFSLPYLNLTIHMLKCSGEHSCVNSTVSIAVLNRTCSLAL